MLPDRGSMYSWPDLRESDNLRTLRKCCNSLADLWSDLQCWSRAEVPTLPALLIPPSNAVPKGQHRYVLELLLSWVRIFLPSSGPNQGEVELTLSPRNWDNKILSIMKSFSSLRKFSAIQGTPTWRRISLCPTKKLEKIFPNQNNKKNFKKNIPLN